MLCTSGFVDDVILAHNGSNADTWSLRRSELFTVTRQVAPLNSLYAVARPSVVCLSSRGTPPTRELNTTGVAKYSDFGLIEGYISETVQDRR